ncbi:STAS-like domain-containing protein [Thiolapillus sp.]
MKDDDFIRQALLMSEAGTPGIGTRLAEQFGISRAAASARLNRIVAKGLLTASGKGRGKRYAPALLSAPSVSYSLPGLSEDIVWRELVSEELAMANRNARDIWHYGVTEMVNNAIDHSLSETVEISLEVTALGMRCWIKDTGEGIFKKIQQALDLYDPRDALIELAKGKFTTDPEHHTGEGIFFSSKVFDCFRIHSGGLIFAHDAGSQDIMVEHDGSPEPGTVVYMALRHDSNTVLSQIMDEYAAPEEYSFSKTIVPIRLAAHEGEKLVSRSQAKRVTFRFERFENVVLDFTGVEEIGQAFADELFRVFQNTHPETILAPINMSRDVEKMVARVKHGQNH